MQCSELCGVWHGFMPIAIEAVSVQDYLAWIDAAQYQTNADTYKLPQSRGDKWDYYYKNLILSQENKK